MTRRQDERGFAMVMTMFMVLVLTVLGSSMMFVSRTEALSSLNYKTMSQGRYAAESGLHSAVNFLLSAEYQPPTATSADSLAFYNLDTYPVTLVADGSPVTLSSIGGTDPHYPAADVQAAFANRSQGALAGGIGNALFTASARLLSMKVIVDSITHQPITLQTWEVTGRGTLPGAANARVEVSAIVERQQRPIYPYAAFAQDPGCDALRFGGGAITDSYDSNLYSGTGTPAKDNHSGNVGTNGNLSELGSTTTLHGSLSTPRSGVGNCTSGNVTGLTTSGNPTLDGGMIQLPQQIIWPTPPPPDPMPPSANDSLTKNNGCANLVTTLSSSQCVTTANGAVLDPGGSPLVLGDLSLGAQAKVHLKAGVYIVNSIKMNSQAELILDSGPVVFQVAGQGQATPIDMTGGSFSNQTYKAANFQFVYGGTGAVKMAGGAGASGLVYAPNATLSFTGHADFYGAVLGRTITDLGGAELHYDRALDNEGLTAGNPTMTAFTWRSF